MKKHLVSLLVGVAAAGSVTSVSPAQALTWNLNNVRFGFGASDTATGSFNYDATNNSYTNVFITVNVGGGSVVQTFTQSNVVGAGSSNSSLFVEADRGASTIPTTARYLGLRLIFAEELGNTIGTSIDIETSNGDSYLYTNATPLLPTQNNPFNRLNVQGEASVTSVPFDIPGGATIPTVGSILALGAMRQFKKRMIAKNSVSSPVGETVN
jgi:hypothetical protein